MKGYRDLLTVILFVGLIFLALALPTEAAGLWIYLIVAGVLAYPVWCAHKARLASEESARILREMNERAARARGER